MVPGPTFIHKCTTCGNLLTKQSSRSGNTFGATIYSDGKVIAPSNREFPLITKCSKCEQILWLGGDNYTGIESEYFIREYEGVAVEESRFLTINEYVIYNHPHILFIDNDVINNPSVAGLINFNIAIPE